MKAYLAETKTTSPLVTPNNIECGRRASEINIFLRFTEDGDLINMQISKEEITHKI